MSASIDSFANSAKPFVDSMDLVRRAPNCSVCVDKHLASQHCATCDDVMCEEAVSVHRELVKCWAADQHVMVRVRDMDPNMSATAKAVIAVRTKIDARLTKLQNFRRELLGREARAGQKLWTVSFYSHPLTPPFFFSNRENHSPFRPKASPSSNCLWTRARQFSSKPNFSSIDRLSFAETIWPRYERCSVTASSLDTMQKWMLSYLKLSPRNRRRYCCETKANPNFFMK